jgi:hypothetical protein
LTASPVVPCSWNRHCITTLQSYGLSLLTVIPWKHNKKHTTDCKYLPLAKLFTFFPNTAMSVSELQRGDAENLGVPQLQPRKKLSRRKWFPWTEFVRHIELTIYTTSTYSHILLI